LVGRVLLVSTLAQPPQSKTRTSANHPLCAKEHMHEHPAEAG
jgi:hypothetical protein